MTAPAFRRVLKGAMGQEVLIPLILSYLWNPNFKPMTIKLDGFQARGPDGWFHPSTHPLMPAPFLYWYLVAPDRLEMELFDPNSTMAVTAGKFWHDFHQTLLLRVDALKPNPNPLPKTSPAEWPWQCDRTGARGSTDGIVNGEGLGLDTDEIFEFKTMHEAIIAKMPKGPPNSAEVVGYLKDRKPEYYAQAQEYMRLSGYRRWRGIVQQISYPFSMREIVIEFDPFYAYDIEKKYLMVRQAAADGVPPIIHCCGEKACPAKALCKG